MTLYKLRAGLRGLAALLLVVAAAGAAHGAVYEGSWDPAYGQPFGTPPLGWRGTATWDVADSCTGPGSVAVSGGCTATLTDALVEFYVVGEIIGTDVEPTRAKIVYTADMSILNLLFSATTKPVLLGIDTNVFAYTTPTSVLGTNTELFGVNIPDFALEFNIDSPYNGPLLYWRQGQGCGTENRPNCNGTNDTTGNSIPTLTITREGVAFIPEPGSLALVFGGLLAAAGIGRLRRRRG